MMAIGYFKHCDHERFEIYAYHTGSMNGYDSITEQFREYSHAFYHIPESLEVVCEQIRFDDLHILIFLDIGMDKNTNPIAGLRLAPVQCVWAGHPDTTGLSTIDYFLSSDAHEIEDAQQHYSEKLIRLPNLSHVYTKPSIPDLNKTRSDMGLPEDVPIYVSCQMPFKYLPQYDYLFPEILKRVPSAKVVFCLGGKDDILAEFVENRIKNAFKRSGLDSEISCIFLGRLEFNDYLNLLSICDASLDTIGFTGSNTTLQAIACGLPVVTLPTELMRGRQSYGIFKTLGVMDTVASSEAEYIEIAVRLCSDSAWRESIIQKMKANQHLLYDDITCVKALEQFFVQVVSDYCPIE
jgi:predicted O-linked N-acetylglucosamine transferase (SPINDLY family)